MIWRIISKKFHMCNIYRFTIGSAKAIIAIGVPIRTGSKPEYAFDNNYNTYVGAASIGMDFKTFSKSKY